MLDTFIHRVRNLRGEGESVPIASLLLLSDDLRRLALPDGRQAIRAYLESHIDRPDFQATNSYTPGAIILDRGRGWLIRLVTWTPRFRNERDAHSHPFDLLTVGLTGPGYQTEIQACDPHELQRRRPGDRVWLGDPARLQLTQGLVHYYPADRIVHRQRAPRADSISLNVFMWALTPLTQYFVDAERCAFVRRRAWDPK
jgi:hypothetical protein